MVDEIEGKNPTILIDCYPKVEGRPLIAIFKKAKFEYKLPEWLDVVREITDEAQYSRRIMCKKSYYMEFYDKMAQSNDEVCEVTPKPAASPWLSLQPAPSDPVFGLIHLF